MMATEPKPSVSLLLAESKAATRIIGADCGLRHVLDAVRIVAPTDTTVLLGGETGTGKELIARAIHDQSSRSRSAYVKVNCAAIPAGLLESELFGHERGAFTGALTQTPGRFQLADRGTLFLDEIGDLPLELQPKLLRVLQEREFERLGSSRTIKIDVRIVAATNRDLAALVRERLFRADLFYRLNVFPIPLPPLRERSQDIPELVWHFAKAFSGRMNKEISAVASETMESLLAYPWPGNIRELQNFIERAVIMPPSPVLRPPISDLKVLRKTSSLTLARTLSQVERDHIAEVLDGGGWVVGGRNGAAARLGLPRSTLMARMSKLGIDPVIGNVTTSAIG